MWIPFCNNPYFSVEINSQKHFKAKIGHQWIMNTTLQVLQKEFGTYMG